MKKAAVRLQLLQYSIKAQLSGSYHEPPRYNTNEARQYDKVEQDFTQTVSVSPRFHPVPKIMVLQ